MPREMPSHSKGAAADAPAVAESSKPKSTGPQLWDPEHLFDLVQLDRHELAKKEGAATAPTPLKSFTYTPGSVIDAQAKLLTCGIAEARRHRNVKPTF